MPVGIEGLGQGLLQGYQFGLQQKRLAQQDERQVAQDERQAVQDAALAKTQDIANRTNEFQLQTGQKNQALAEKQQAQKTVLNQGVHDAIMAYNGGDYNAAGQRFVDLNNNDVFGNKFKMTFKGSSVKMGKDGKPAVDEDGHPIVEYDMESTDASGKTHPVKMTHKDFTVATMNQLDPMAAEKARQDKLEAKQTKVEDSARTLKSAITLEGIKSANDLKLEQVRAQKAWEIANLQYGNKFNNLTNNGRALLQMQETVDDGMGGTKTITRFDDKKFQAFAAYAEANKLKGNDADVRHWIAKKMPGYVEGGGTDAGGKPKDGALYDPSNLDPKVKAVINDVDLSQAKPSAVKEPAPIPVAEKPKQAAAVQKDTAPAKPVSKSQTLVRRSGMRGTEKQTTVNNVYQEIQGKYGDPIPDGFKRKSSYGDIYGKEYNTFVSNNYED
jgi:hypothetical protein